MKRRIVAAVLLIAMMLSLMAACGTKPAETTGAPAPTQGGNEEVVKDVGNFAVPEGGYDGSAVTITFYNTMGANLAAKVDGCGDLKYLWKVMIPLALPTLISITILKMMGAWNSYVWPRLVANDEAHRLITNGLRNAFTATTGDVNYPVQMAAVAIVSAPLFLVFVFLRKYIMAGVSRSGIKG